MRAAALAAAVVAFFIGVMYVRFSGDTVPAPNRYAAGQPTCVVFRPVSSEERDEGDEQPVTCDTIASVSTPGPVRTPPPAPPLRRFSDAEIEAIEFGVEIEFPEDTVMIVEGGCFQCDPPPRELVRVYRDPSGSFRIESLFSPEKVGLGPRFVDTASGVVEEPPFVTGFASATGASEIIAAVCARGSCGILEALSPDALTVFFRSTDGGVTWRHYAETGGLAFPIGLVEPGIVLASVQEGPSNGSLPPTYRLFPSGETVSAPFGSVLWPTATGSGEIFWSVDNGAILNNEGELLFAPPGAGLSCCTRILDGDPADDSIAVVMRYTDSVYLVEIGPEGETTRAFSVPNEVDLQVFDSADDVVWGATSARRALSNLPSGGPVGPVPALVDLDSRKIQQVGGPFLEPPFDRARNTVYAVQRGPFARVVNAEGTCLNVRDQPALDARVIDCFSDGVLLRDISHGLVYPGDWVKVVTPGFVVGWASTQYLER